jgi:hypothetical protein
VLIARDDPSVRRVAPLAGEKRGLGEASDDEQRERNADDDAEAAEVLHDEAPLDDGRAMRGLSRASLACSGAVTLRHLEAQA